MKNNYLYIFTNETKEINEMNEINEHNKQIQQNEINESTCIYIYTYIYTLYIDFLGSAKQPGFFIAPVSLRKEVLLAKMAARAPVEAEVPKVPTQNTKKHEFKSLVSIP